MKIEAGIYSTMLASTYEVITQKYKIINSDFYHSTMIAYPPFSERLIVK
jgi:hypothetical protein